MLMAGFVLGTLPNCVYPKKGCPHVALRITDRVTTSPPNELNNPVAEAIVAYLIRHQRLIPQIAAGSLTFSFGRDLMQCVAKRTNGEGTTDGPIVIPLPIFHRS